MASHLQDHKRVLRFSAPERMVHWAVALAFLYTMLTGLPFWSPRLYWIAAVFGGGETAGSWHPWAGILYALLLAVMSRSWIGMMRLDAEDRRWLRLAHRYAVHDESDLPDAGRFNAGQKMLFWLQATSALLLLSSGLVLWWPGSVPRTLRELAILVHPVTAVASIGGLIVHIYMSTTVVPGAFRGMTRGWVTLNWASSHHPKWYRQLRRD